ncbi:ATP-grasp domain-containing protein [Streptomyces triticirhizae]|uniref:ATP-grasp domain-containing protein n=1 Tax=Streptomyces triticirhizae TaxID=2483353 RepID=A0A3M2M3J9_9ACTN|nr:ATP-grasp domain-containing protein [Streptomyces triticirhizae]RMI43393.1 ATP-grasp domain-containing protein [Streptomyces triticirhizae]
MRQRIHVISSDSVAGWLPEFRVAEADRPRLAAPTDRAELAALETAPGEREFVFVSDHDTLARDLAWAGELRRAGHPVRCQSATAVGLALDKVEMKRFLRRSGVATPPWRAPRRAAPDWPMAPADAVWKQRTGTQSRGIRLGRSSDTPSADEYGEVYRDGVEFSVNVFARQGTATVLPPVWKGPTSRQLVPPWQRTRLCAPGTVAPELAARLVRTAADLAGALEADGFLEVEYLVGDDGVAQVLEINPRVSGTLRMSALAAAEPILSWYDARPLPESLPALRCAVEVPHAGPRFVLPERGVYATSRLTVVAATPQELLHRIDGLRALGVSDAAVDALLDETASPLLTDLPAMAGV